MLLKIRTPRTFPASTELRVVSVSLIGLEVMSVWKNGVSNLKEKDVQCVCDQCNVSLVENVIISVPDPLRIWSCSCQVWQSFPKETHESWSKSEATVGPGSYQESSQVFFRIQSSFLFLFNENFPQESVNPVRKVKPRNVQDFLQETNMILSRSFQDYIELNRKMYGRCNPDLRIV